MQPMVDLKYITFGFSYLQVIRMLFVIIVVFVLCWLPFLLFNVLQAFGVVELQLQKNPNAKHTKTAFTLMAYLNR